MLAEDQSASSFPARAALGLLNACGGTYGRAPPYGILAHGDGREVKVV